VVSLLSILTILEFPDERLRKKAAVVKTVDDHLNGKLFVDYISSLKRQRIKKKLEKIHKMENN